MHYGWRKHYKKARYKKAQSRSDKRLMRCLDNIVLPNSKKVK